MIEGSKDLRGIGHREEGRDRELIPSEYIVEAKTRLLAALERVGVIPTSETKMLEIGAGTGELTKELIDSGYNVVALDIYPAEGPEIPLVIARAEEMPFGDGSFDVIFAFSAFDSHFYPGQAQKEMLSEVLRTLNPRGVFVHFGIHGEKQVQDNVPTELKLVSSKDGFDVYQKQ